MLDPTMQASAPASKQVERLEAVAPEPTHVVPLDAALAMCSGLVG